MKSQRVLAGLSFAALLLSGMRSIAAETNAAEKIAAGKELEKLGAKTGLAAATRWPRLTPKLVKMQKKDRFTLVVIGADWKGGAEGVKHLKKLPGVRGIMFSHPKATDEWCECLKAMPKLKEVYFQQAGITDKTAAVLGKLKELEAVSLVLTSVTDRGLERLKDLSKLQFLALVGTKVTDAGLAHLAELTELRQLNLDSTDTTGDGNPHLKDFEKLEWLRLSGQLIVKPNGKLKLAKAEVQHLAGMKKLRYLSVGGMRTPEADLKKLLKQLPELKSIDANNKVLTRDGWKERDISAALERIRGRIRANIRAYQADE